MNIKAFLALLLVFCILFPALAQNKPAAPKPAQTQTQTSDDKDDVVKITTNLVQVDVVVTKDEKPVTNLTADDFEIFEDGKRQTITSFTYISNVLKAAAEPTTAKTANDNTPYKPLKPNEARRIMAIVVDDLGLSAESMYQVKRQLRQFVAEKLDPNDLVAIIRTGRQSGALQQFTNDKRLLNRAMDQLRWNSCSRVGINVLPAFGKTLPGEPGSEGACSYRSIESSIGSLGFIIDAMGHLPGRKSLVFLSDDLPMQSQDDVFTGQEYLRGSARTGVSDSAESSAYLPDARNLEGSLKRIAERAIRNSVVIYSVDTQGVQDTGWTAADVFTGSLGDRQKQSNKLMSDRFNLIYGRREGGGLIAKQTGGFQVRNSNSYEFDRILEDQSGYYLLGYRPTDETFNRRFHHIKAKVKGSGLTLRTRNGFYGVTEEDAKRLKPTARDSTNLALASPFDSHDIELDVTSFFVDDKASGPVIRSFVYIDPKGLTLTPVNGRHQGSIELHGAIFGDNGEVVERLAHGANLNLRPELYEQATRYGLGMGFDIPVKQPGAYQVRIAALDRPSSRIGSAGQFVVVPDLKKKRIAVSGIVLAKGNADQTFTDQGSRKFLHGSNLYFAYDLYNAVNDSGKLRNLVMDVTLLRDGKNVQTRPQVPIVASNPDLSRVYVNGLVPLTAELEPGYYYLQIVVSDKDAKSKTAPVVQWADFEIEGSNTKN
jgi:VWFA-related protein